MKLPRYPKYKESGVKWLGQVPEHWEAWKIRHAFQTIGSGTTPRSESQEYYEDGEYAWLNSGDLRDDRICMCSKRVTKRALQDHSALKMYPLGSVAIAMYGATAGKLGILDFPATVNQACCVFTGSTVIESKFLFYSLFGCRQTIMSFTAGGGQPNISQDVLRALKVPRPSHSEQIQIVRFLDIETGKIDALIAEQQRLIELLAEKRQAIISHAVTKGLNPDATMKRSGVNWLGEVPAHWEVKSLKRLARPGRKTFTDGDWVELPYITDEGVRLIQTGNIGIGFYKEQGFRYISEESFDALKCTEVLLSDVLICRLDGPVGRACLAPNLSERMITSVDNTILKVSRVVDPRYVVYLLSSEPWLKWIEVLCRVGGGFRVRVSRTMLGNLLVSCPPHGEQVEISDWLDKHCKSVNELLMQVQVAIGRLEERRSALISAAVTGQIDVRNYRPEEAAAVCQ